MTNSLINLIDTEQIYQNAPCGYIFMLPEGTIIKLNKTILDWLGYTEEEVVGKLSFTDLLSKGGAIHYELFFRPIISINGNVKELNYELAGANSRVFPALISANGVTDEKGKLLGINMVVTDITQRNLYEKELLQTKIRLQAEKTRFELLADLSGEMIWTVNKGGEVSYINGQMARYFNLQPGDPVSSTIFQKIHPEDKKNLITAWNRTSANLEVFNERIRFQTSQGKYEWFAIRLVSIDDGVTEIKWFGTGINIDQHVLDLERKDEFINMASHELKTPVTVLKGFLQLLQLDIKRAEATSFVSRSLDAVNNLQFLISSLLNVSIINSGKLVLRTATFSLNQLLRSCVDQLSAITKTHTIILELDQEDVFVFADKERITQVLTNLINNAVKYSPGKQEVIVSGTLPAGCEVVTVSVRDHGAGIPADELTKIFERYYRVNETQFIKGLGLGLYISQNILLAHGSTLIVKSTLDEGSVFSFDLTVSV